MNINKYFLSIFLGYFLVFPFFCLPAQADSANENIFYMSHSKEDVGIKSLETNAGEIDILAPQFYGVSDKLQLVGSLDSQLKKVISHLPAQAGKKIKVMPLLSNAGFKQSVIHNLLISPKAQDTIIKGLVDIAKKDNYIGWQFDFENISYLDKDLYSAFIEKTAAALHKNNLILSVAAITRNCDYENTDVFKNWSGAFDYARIAKAVDFISLMTYDDPNSTGPVASLPFVNSVLNYVKDKIPAGKLSLGIPLYYWGWSTTPSEKINSSGTYSRLSQIMSNFQCSSGFDADLSAPWVSYFFQNKQYKIWYQNEQSFNARLGIIKQNNFRGFSAWVLGVEDPGIWSVLNKAE